MKENLIQDIDFQLRIKELLSDYNQESMINWLKRSNEIKRIPSSEFYKWLLEELSLVCEQYNVDIAKKLFNYGEIFTLDPYEIKGAAEHLKAGGDINKICDLALEGLLD